MSDTQIRSKCQPHAIADAMFDARQVSEVGRVYASAHDTKAAMVALLNAIH